MLNIQEIKNTLLDRNIRSVVLSATVSSVATLTLNILVSVYVVGITGSAANLALVLVAGTVPFVFLSAFAGILCDRKNKKSIFIYADLSRVILAVLLLLLLLETPKHYHVNILYIAVFIFSILEVFSTASLHSIIPCVVKKEKILDANVVFNGLARFGPIIAPLLGVFIYGWLGIEWSIVTIGGMYLFSYFMGKNIYYIPILVESTQTLSVFIRSEVASFRKLLSSDIRVTSLNINGFATHLVLYPFLMIGLPYLIIQIFKGTPANYGVAEVFAAVGMLMSAFFIPWFKHYGSAVNLLLGMVGMFLGSLIFLLLLNSDFQLLISENSLLRVSFFALANFVIFFSFGFYGVFFSSFLHANIDKSVIGRGMAIQLTLIGMGRLIGFLVFGYLFTISLKISILVLILGMFCKFIIHIPFFVNDIKSNKIDIQINQGSENTSAE